MVPTNCGEHESSDVEGVAKDVCRDVTVALHNTTECFPPSVVSVVVLPKRHCSSSRPWVVLLVDRKPRLKVFRADAGCFRGQVGGGGEFALHISSQNKQHKRGVTNDPPLNPFQPIEIT
jgi:hypothetical protein